MIITRHPLKKAKEAGRKEGALIQYVQDLFQFRPV
jgi:hypothetical protein